MAELHVRLGLGACKIFSTRVHNTACGSEKAGVSHVSEEGNRSHIVLQQESIVTFSPEVWVSVGMQSPRAQRAPCGSSIWGARAQRTHSNDEVGRMIVLAGAFVHTYEKRELRASHLSPSLGWQKL